MFHSAIKCLFHPHIYLNTYIMLPADEGWGVGSPRQSRLRPLPSVSKFFPPPKKRTLRQRTNWFVVSKFYYSTKGHTQRWVEASERDRWHRIWEMYSRQTLRRTISPKLRHTREPQDQDLHWTGLALLTLFILKWSFWTVLVTRGQ